MSKTDARTQLAKRLRALRAKHDMTQDELAGAAGISTKYLQNLEGKTPKAASIDTLQHLAEALDMPLARLLKFDE